MTTIFRARPSDRAAGRGFTIVELLISVTIGLLLVVVIAQLFLGSRQTFATNDDVSRMQDNIRYAQQLLIRTIHVASYRSKANANMKDIFNGPTAALAGTNGAGSASDTITIRFQGSGDGSSDLVNCKSTNPPNCTGADGSVVDCLGVKIDAGMMAVNTFSIAVGANGRNALFCHNGVGPPGPGVELVPDVDNMQILFGEDTDGDLVANHYVPVDVTTPDKVVSVRIALLFQTPTATSKVVPVATSYDMLGDGSVVLNYPADRRIRRLVTNTINLRNRTP
jgi:type IV pilus assembly protein PilW